MHLFTDLPSAVFNQILILFIDQSLQKIVCYEWPHQVLKSPGF